MVVVVVVVVVCAWVCVCVCFGTHVPDCVDNNLSTGNGWDRGLLGTQ